MTASMRGDADVGLLEAWRAGDMAAGRSLFEKHFTSVHDFFRNRAAGYEQDLTQRTLLACVEGQFRFRGDASFRTYLFSIARHQLLTHFRERRRQSQLLPLSDEEEAQLTSPSSVVARKQNHGLLLQALRRLAPHHREVITLVHWNSLSRAEIARLLNIPESTARSRVLRANEVLRHALRELGDAGTPPKHECGESDERDSLGLPPPQHPPASGA
jgi:RNA polymerase sigma factor (sigma-70 family)